jgi:diguanylate cyclase (GGDEF)-like protein/excisionase family DNA binding protein
MQDFAAQNQPAGDVRSRTSALIRERQDALASDITSYISSALGETLDAEGWHGCSELLLRLFAASVDAGSLDTDSAAMRDLQRFSPPLTTRQLLEAVHQAERVILDEIALDERLGATSEPWPAVAHVIRRATLEILGAHAEQVAGRDVPVAVRDPLTTLIAAPVFALAVAQEIERALRHQHSLTLMLFDIDDLSQINREHGYGVGDRLLERLGILARQFFRTHDWVGRYGDDAIAVLLPETMVDQGASLAATFREMVQHRLVLHNHKTDSSQIVTVSAAVVGTDLVQSGELESAYVLAEAEAAVLRAKLNGRNRIERVALLPTSLTIFGAATMLELTPREVARLIRAGTLKATRRGRHWHIDRELIDTYRKAIR